jgi:orotidine-5'-phosphate decarboxylase
MLRGVVGFFKIGLELFSKEGPGVVDLVREIAPEAGIFLDLKFHDIPATVGRAVKAAARLRPDLITVHAQGGQNMLKAAVENASGSKILAITLLTSLGPQDMGELKPDMAAPGAYVLFLAKRAVASGCHGVVASAQELTLLRGSLGPGPIIAVPGIRPGWTAGIRADDQVRVGTPGQAISQGATYLVMGRPIRNAIDPVEVAQGTIDEIASASE